MHVSAETVRTTITSGSGLELTAAGTDSEAAPARTAIAQLINSFVLKHSTKRKSCKTHPCHFRFAKALYKGKSQKQMEFNHQN